MKKIDKSQMKDIDENSGKKPKWLNKRKKEVFGA